jgi:hypothetical protein
MEGFPSRIPLSASAAMHLTVENFLHIDFEFIRINPCRFPSLCKIIR